MTKPFIPELGERIIPEVIREKTVKGILNQPPVGTRIRATLGETVIVGTVYRHSSYELLSVKIDPTPETIYGHLLENFSLWPEAGWTFELLTDDETDAA